MEQPAARCYECLPASAASLEIALARPCVYTRSAGRFLGRRNAVNWTQLLKDEITTTYATTAKLLDKVDPDNLDWKPSSGGNWMTTRQLLKHITNACGAPSKGFVTGDWGLPEGKRLEDLTPEEMMPSAGQMPAVGSVEEAKKLLSEDQTTALEMIDRAGEDDLANKQVAAPWAPGVSHVLGRHLLQMAQHLDRHKSQLFYYLKLQGKPVNTEDLWG
jgi:DinB superfamily